jgi:hypothetical protein
MYESGDVEIQDVELSRSEFEALKIHLASVRGYPLVGAAKAAEVIRTLALDEFGRPEAAWNKQQSELSDLDNQSQLALFIQTARDVYRKWPEIVTSSEEGLDEAIESVASLEPSPALISALKASRCSAQRPNLGPGR